MFGKSTEPALHSWHSLPFQSPCAGNMFGKAELLDNLKKIQKHVGFQSPCAGNMFGKVLTTTFPLQRRLVVVSIPVCGEHVW